MTIVNCNKQCEPDETKPNAIMINPRERPYTQLNPMPHEVNTHMMHAVSPTPAAAPRTPCLALTSSVLLLLSHFRAPSLSGLPRWCLWPTFGVARKLPPPPSPAPSLLTSPRLRCPPRMGGYLVHPPFLPCKPLGSDVRDACAAYGLCRDGFGFDLPTWACAI